MVQRMISGELERVLTEHLGSPISLRAEPSPISGGFWAAIYGFEIATVEPAGSTVAHEWLGRLVLRVMPSRERAKHEIIIQRAVADSGFPTPRVLHDGYDEALGGAFMIMPYAAGKPPMAGLGPGSLLSVPRLLRRLPVQLAEVAAQLHAIDPQPIRLALEHAGLGRRGDGAQTRLDAIKVAAGTDARGFDQLLTWFDQRRPHDPSLVMCHGDLHPFNLLIDDAGRTTVLDWTNGELMPREFEVGFTAGLLRCAPIKVPNAARPIVRRLTAWMAQRFIESYERSAMLDSGRLAWYEALQHARCLAEVATARTGLTDIVDTDHPFETSAAAMTVRLAEITGVTITLPTRQPAPTS
jgi:aminoglycoside phosphotransferase (APT) family kinase protein